MDSKSEKDRVDMFVESWKETSGTYNESLLHDSVVRLTVKALSFSPNLNKFLHKKKVLELSHKNAFGEVIPAYKSFERQLVNSGHIMVDNRKTENKVIGYVEKSTLRDDGVYLDLWIWKRTLTDSELSQLRNKTASCSMEVEFTEPVVRHQSGMETKLIPGTPVPPGAVRTMSDNSTVSFIGIAVLFDGIKPADPRSGLVCVENATVEPTVLVTAPSEIDLVSEELSTVLCKEEGGSMNLPEFKAQIEALEQELTEAKSSRERAEADLQALSAEFEAKKVAAEEQENKLTEALQNLDTLNAELYAMRQTVFMSNVEALVNLDALDAETKEWCMEEFRCDCFGHSDPACYEAVAARFAAVAAALKKVPEVPGSSEEDAAAVPAAAEVEVAEEVPASEDAPAAAPEVEVTEDQAELKSEEDATAAPAETETAALPAHPAVAANLAGSPSSAKDYTTRSHLT